MAEIKIYESLNGKHNNYILPFFWQHGEDDETLLREIEAIYNSGIRALCVESRTHEEFCEDGWWNTLDFILSECQKRDMKVWILDDKHFPSGYANGIIPKKYPDQAMWAITERHIDITGPMNDASVLVNWKTSDEDVLLGVVACKRVSGVKDVILTGESIDLTDCLFDDMVYFDVPEGTWRIFYLLKSRSGFFISKLKYCDKLTEFGGDAFIEAVYQPHWEHYSKYFGNTLAGFFSDEPCFGNNNKTGFRAELGRKYSHFPYSDEVIEKMNEKFDNDAFAKLPFLWFDTADTSMQNTRLAYMDIITQLYSKNFTYKLGNWCREHGIEYIGHIVEDDHQHLGTQDSSGHFFRALDGQDMAGIDVVLCQIVPGLTDDSNTVPCSYDICYPDFYHFTLPKLGSSHSHIQPEKSGRAMCEIFGAYGWAEGLKMMKWLTDLMLVRGNNYFVPHAFTPKFPDYDCPPHMFAGGTNPQFTRFKTLMEYMNRVCHIFNGGKHFSSAAVLYEAEASWSGGKFKFVDETARYLTEHHLDFDIIPTDYLEKAVIDGKTFKLSNENYPALVVPYAEYLPTKTLNIISRMISAGITVYFIDDIPRCAESGKKVNLVGCNVISLCDLESLLRDSGVFDVTVLKTDDSTRYLRFYHYNVGNTHYYMVTNEGIYKTIDTILSFSVFNGGTYTIYDAMNNKAWSTCSKDGKVDVNLPPYTSTILVFGEQPDLLLPNVKKEKIIESYALECTWDISVAKEEDYPVFTPYKTTDKLFNITGRNELPRFSGHIKYESSFNFGSVNDKKVYINLGEAGESVTLTINGVNVGVTIVPPYRFDITKSLRQGENTITVEVTNHYGYALRDNYSKYLLFEPSGLLGPVSIEVCE